MHELAYRQLQELESSHWWFRARKRVCRALLREHLGGLRLGRALDVGAGFGGFLDSLSELAEEVVHCELEHGLVSRSRERGHRLGVVAAGDRLPFRAASFDLLTLLDVLEHIADDRHALGELRRVLRPAGLLFLHVPAHPFLYANNDRASGHHRRYTRRGLRRLVEEAGFEVLRASYTNSLLFPLIAPAVVGLRCLESLARSPVGAYTNLSWSRGGPLGRLLEETFASERFLSRRHDLPLGHSLALLARVPSAPVQ